MTSLWEKIRQEDTSAMVSLYEQTYADLLSYGVQLSNSNEVAKDAINDVFVDIWDNRSKLKPVEHVRAYLFACIRRKIFQSIASHRKISNLPEDMQLFNDQGDLSYEDILVAMQRSDEIRYKVQKALEKLTGRQRELIQMKYFKGMDYQQIESETGISMKTVYNTIYNAMKILADELRDILFVLIFLFLS
ncbi:sigma-70 family RNA polymerase sigma factor [Pseudoflavitalea sp. X16]|uniref:RNA polymerase sigma factor n=1 Tax=Paraflavitalea devenefica TaxID=2716334 RepID=UPI001420E7E9|nr:sigma-70 family RNA polymerase sigma factor [Paraflavitalea devenefica]NII26436.1 sigma-70 family RNA polymerase sigma factor [Paraflavitalea devenefica]